MRKYLGIFRIRFSNGLQYRAAALAGLATQFTWGFMEILAFSAFYRANSAAFPMEFSHTVSYIWMQQAFLAIFMVWFFESDIFNSITSGGIAYELVRPIDLYGRWFCLSAANRLSRAVLRCLPILIVALIVPEPFRMSLPTRGLQFFLFLISMVLSLCVIVSYTMIVYISTFYTLSPMGVRIISVVIADFLAGGIIPLPFFIQPFRAIAEVLPFAAMQNMPLRIYSGNIAGISAIHGIGLQIFWFTVLLLIGKLMMKNALRKVLVQGG